MTTRSKRIVKFLPPVDEVSNFFNLYNFKRRPDLIAFYAGYDENHLFNEAQYITAAKKSLHGFDENETEEEKALRKKGKKSIEQ